MKVFEVEIVHTPTGQYTAFSVEYPDDYTPDDVAEAVWRDTSINVDEAS
jgi:hypothetical protein